ncbi:MAG: hypothetical protein QXD93_02870 [Ignisphaera sp.]
MDNRCNDSKEMRFTISPSTNVERYAEPIASRSILSILLRLGLPLMLTDAVLYTIADTYWLSRYISHALAVSRQT